MKERFEVEATESCYLVLDPKGTVVATVERRPQAFEFVRDRGGRVHLQWARTLIGKETVPRDFSATHSGFGAGRTDRDQRGSARQLGLVRERKRSRYRPYWKFFSHSPAGVL